MKITNNKHNDEKLWKEIENCLEYDNDIYYGDSVFLHTTSIENLMEWFKNKRTKLLKEFVKWYKKVLEQDYDDKARWMADRIKEKDMENYYFYHGQCIAIRRLITLLDNDLEQFFEGELSMTREEKIPKSVLLAELDKEIMISKDIKEEQTEMKAYRVVDLEINPYNLEEKELCVEYYDSKEKVLAKHPSAITFIYKYTKDGIKYCTNPMNVNRAWVYEEIEIK